MGEAGLAVLPELEQALLLRTEVALPVFVFVVLHLSAQAVDLRLHARELLSEIGGLEAQVADAVDRVLPERLDPAPQGAEGVLPGGDGFAGHAGKFTRICPGANSNFKLKCNGNKKKNE